MKHAAILLILLCILQPVDAQKTDFSFINFSSKDGLSSNSVNAIIKDKYGYMWFATGDGLNKFDGINFTIYRNKLSDTATIGGDIINVFYQDKQGNLWIGNHRTLSLYDRKKDAFRNYNFWGNSAVRAICADDSGYLWIGGYAGLYKFHPQKGTVKNYSANTESNQLVSNTILSIFVDSRQRVWIGTNAGLNLFEKHTNKFVRFLHSNSDPTSVADNVVRSITEDPNGNIWFGTNNGLSKLQADGKTFTNYAANAEDPTFLGWNRIYAVRADKLGQLWIGTEEGINIFNIASEKSFRVYPDTRNRYSLNGKSVRSIFIDDAGIYWVGSYQGGVNKYDKNLPFFNLRESNPLDPSGLTSPIVTSFVEDPSGDIYVGTDGGGLNLYHRETGLFSHPQLGPKDKDLTVMTLELLDDDLWIGTYHQGVYVLNIKNGQVKHFVQGDGKNGLSNNDIFYLKKDSKGNMWIGTNGGGVNIYNPKSGKMEWLGEGVSGAEIELTKHWFVRSIEEDKFGNLWIGSNGAGVGIYNPSQKIFKVLNSENNGLPSNIVLSLLLDRNGRMWAGTLGGGLSLFDDKKNRFISYSEKEGISNAVIYKILEDNTGNLWVSTNNSISCFNLQTLKFKNYSYQNGLQRSNFTLGSGLKTSGGEMFFGGLEGFNYFNPLTLHTNKNVPSLQFTALKISNATVVPGEDEAIKEHISIAKEIRLDFKQNFSLDFIALNYTAPGETRYSYKLDGFDKDWNAVGTSHTAVYTNLDPGTYVFHVIATSDDGSWTTPEKTIRIFVRPPFWRTGYAYVLYIILTISTVLFLRYQAMRKLRNRFALEQERLHVKQMVEQERKEAERQREFDQLKIKFLTNLSHEFRTPISLIVGPVDRLASQESDDEKRSQLSMVRRNATRLLNLVNQLLDFRKMDENELKLNLTAGDLVSFVKEVSDSFQEMAGTKQVRFTFSTSFEQYTTLFDQDKVERILLNLLSNAFKFTPGGGSVSLKIEPGIGESLKIVVADTGIGMRKEVHEHIFDRFFQASDNGDVLNQGSGIGLSIAKEFAKLHGGTIEVDSEPGKGSVFTVSLPCKLIDGSTCHPQKSVSNDQDKKFFPAQKNGTAQSVTVLLIEDNDDFRHYLRDSLKHYYKIVEACDGKEGWQKVLAAHPHVVVSDINMPGMDGITLSRKIKSDKRTCHIPVLLLTAITGHSNQVKGLETGASDYLTKPFNFEILNVKIRNLIALNQNLKHAYSKQLQVVPTEIEIQSDDEKLLTRIAHYIEVNIDSPDLSVEELSKHVFMSRGSLYNKIVEMTGETPVEFIRSIKLKKAAALLEKSDMKIAQIGYVVGFSSPNYFARAFKAKYNLSPSEYAEQKRGFAKNGSSVQSQ
jgi:signal transduction histidine kinase/ligand-binding sensor domain-containing protein/AraC-like DNA-binding protein